jgi:hypothetical protein
MTEDEAPHPIRILLLGADAIVLETDLVGSLVEQLGGFLDHGAGSRQGGFAVRIRVAKNPSNSLNHKPGELDD